jgi:tetratricopeptide (TPR) repeat protein
MMKNFMTYLTFLLFLIGQVGLATDSHISLTASDGTGLELQKFEARVALDGFLAFTKLEMVFYNPENRRREGRFQIVLPHNAAISRFAMKIGHHIQEGEVVEKQRARRVYEDFLHRRQDPALLEMDSGNRFNARIFPIERNSEKLLILSYSQRLDDLEGQYVLPLQGLPQLKQFAIKVFYDSDHFNTTQLGELTGTVSKREVLTVEKQNYQPTVDFRMPSQQPLFDQGVEGIAMQSGQLIAAKIIPFTEATGDVSTQTIDNLVVLIDTSASQAPYLADSLKRLETLLSQLNVGILRLYTFDQHLKAIGQADTLETQIALIRQLKSYNALGASRLDAAITTLKALELKQARLLLISDAVITAGETSASTLAGQLNTIDWLTRIDILIPSYHSDKNMACYLAKAGKLPGTIASLTLSDADLIRKLKSPVYADIPIKIAGSSWHWPENVEALQTNEPLMVFGELSSTSIPPKGRGREATGNTIRIQVGDKEFALTSKPAEPILLKREWVRARIDKLLAMEDTTPDKDMKNAFHHEIIKLSVKERVLSPYTALLVLETENDYRRYNIERRGLADILTIGTDGISVLKRTQTEPVRVETPRPTSGEKPIINPSQESVSREQSISAQPLSVDKEDTPVELFDDSRMSSDRPPPPSKKELYRYNARYRAEVEGTRCLQPWIGYYAKFRALLDRDDLKAAGNLAQQWRQDDLADVMALIALGEWYQKSGNSQQAARAYGSLIDYFPARADILRWAAERILALKAESWLSMILKAAYACCPYIDQIPGLATASTYIRRWATEQLLALNSETWLSVDSLEKAVKQRPVHPSGHYLLAIAYWEVGQYQKAVETLQMALLHNYFPRRFQAHRILHETLALMLTHLQHLGKRFTGQKLNWKKITEPQLRLVLMWETDANDVDFHIYDNQQNRAYHGQKDLLTGGSLYADITTGYGPECFSISEPNAFPYEIKAHYYNMGPMGYGMGILHVLHYDPKQGIDSEFRPFVVMKNQAFVELGVVNKP